MPDSREAAWDSLIGDLYLSSVDGEAADRLASSLAAFFHAGTAAFWSLDNRTGAIAGRMLQNFTPESIALYRAHWYAYDPWTLPLAREGTGRVVRGSDLIDDAALLRHPFYAEYGVHSGHFHVMGSVFAGSERSHEVGAIAMQRARDRGAFNDEDLRLLARLLPHARRAHQLEARVRSELVPLFAGRAALDAMSTAAIVLDGAGAVLHANAAAETLDRAGGPVRLRRQGEDGRISALRPADTAWLREAVSDAARGGAGGARRLPDSADRAHAAVVTPLPRRFADRDGGGWLPGMALLVLRMVEPLAAPARLEELCMAIFCLTRSEAQAACLLAGGMSPEEIARSRDVRVTTVRTLLARGMDKSGARNLRHFVGLLSALTV